jgi:hypothetical protein
MAAEGSIPHPEGLDVVCGSSKHVNIPGNKLLKDLVESQAQAYKSAANNPVKNAIVNEIYEVIASQNGRFIEKAKDSSHFSQLSKSVALERIRRQLRNAAKPEGVQTPPLPSSGVTSAVASATSTPVISAVAAPVPPISPPFPSDISPPPNAPSVTKDQYVVVARDRLLKGQMSTQHALHLMEGLSFHTEEARLQGVEFLLGQLNAEKSVLKEWARERIQEAMVETAITLNIKYLDKEFNSQPVKTYDGLVLSWETDNSPENQDTVHKAVYGMFQADKSTAAGKSHYSAWIEMAEQVFMNEKRLTYPPGTNKTGGYVYAIISLALNKTQQKIKTRGLKRHGIWMGTDNARTVGTPGRNKKQKTSNDADAESVGSSMASAQGAPSAVAASKSPAVTPQKKKTTSSKKKAALQSVPEEAGDKKVKKASSKNDSTMATPSAAAILSSAKAASSAASEKVAKPAAAAAASTANFVAEDSDDERRDSVTAALLKQKEPSITQEYAQFLVVAWIVFVLFIMYWFGRG